MNQKTRNLLYQYAERLEQIDEEVESILKEIESIKDIEEEKYDNLPESIQESERGELFQEGIERLEEILEYLEERQIQDAISLLREF